MYMRVRFFLFVVFAVVFGVLIIKSVKIYNENTFADGNVLCTRIYSWSVFSIT